MLHEIFEKIFFTLKFKLLRKNNLKHLLMTTWHFILDYSILGDLVANRAFQKLVLYLSKLIIILWTAFRGW